MAPTYNTAHLPTGVELHYVESGPPNALNLLLLHGYPSSSIQFRKLITCLDKEYHILAPDLPGFGRTVSPPGVKLSFDYLAHNIALLLDHLRITSMVIYVFDYGAPVAWRIALDRSRAVIGMIVQNGNAYEAGLGDWWNPLRSWWAANEANIAEIRRVVHGGLTVESVRRQYIQGVPEALVAGIDPNTWTFDYLDNIKGNEEVQLDLLFDYRTNLAIYPKVQQWFRDRQLPTLVVWGKNDEIFPPIGADAYKADLPSAAVHYIDGGHFLLETHLEQVVDLIRSFLKKHVWTAGMGTGY